MLSSARMLYIILDYRHTHNVVHYGAVTQLNGRMPDLGLEGCGLIPSKSSGRMFSVLTPSLLSVPPLCYCSNTSKTSVILQKTAGSRLQLNVHALTQQILSGLSDVLSKK